MTERHRRGGRSRGPYGEGIGHRAGGRMRRGDIRTALLAALADGPGHGYDVMQALEEKTGGAWRPSPGSVYPTLQLLEDEGLVRSFEREGKRVYEITETGREEADRRIEAAGGTPWEVAERGGRGAVELRMAIAQFHMAFKQIAVGGTPAQIERATEIVRDARRQLFQLLAED